MVRQLFGAGQGVTDEARDMPPQRVIEALHKIGLPGLLRDSFVICRPQALHGWFCFPVGI
jgi:hypothetical protein